MSKFTLTPAHYKKFFATMNRAVARLGLRDEDAKGYYHLVLKEVAHCGSIKTISSAKLYDDCILRFLSDAGEYAQAIDYDQEKVKRYAYVIKVITHQIMQLQRLTPETARAYFDGVVSQSCQGTVGFYSDGERFYLDITIPNLLLFFPSFIFELFGFILIVFANVRLFFADLLRRRHSTGANLVLFVIRNVVHS